MTVPEFLEPNGRPFASPQQLVFRTSNASGVARLLHGLGLAVAERKSDDGSTYLTAQCDGLRLKIIPAADMIDSYETTLHLAVDSLEAALRIARERQAPILQPMHESASGRRAIISDPDGRRIILSQRGTIPTFDIEQDGATETKRPEAEGTPLEVLPAIRAVKRGMAFLLLGGAACFITAVAWALNYRSGPGQFLQSTDFNICIALAAAIVLIGLVLCRLPKSPCINYSTSGAAIALHLTSTVISFAVAGRNPSEHILAQVITALASAVVPFLFFRFVVQVARVARDESLARFGEITNLLWAVSVMMLLAVTGAMFFAPELLAVPKLLAVTTVALLLPSLATIVCFVILTVRFLGFEPIRPKKAVTISLGAD
jgi:hypothetical protein